jgi:uncharacterized protein (TIGR03437 family)
MNRYSCPFVVLVCAALLSIPTARGAAAPRVLYRIETVAGSARTGDGGPAIAAQLSNIQGVAVDRFGNLYLSDTDNHRVRKVSPSGVISTLAGTGSAGFSGDGGPAAAAQLNLPYGLAVDLAGYVYVADLGNSRVRRITPDGVIATVAGTGRKIYSPDGGAAADASLLTPRSVAVDAAGNLYVSEFEGHRVRKVSPDGRITTVAGTGVVGFRGDGLPAINAQLGFPAGLAVDRAGALYIADSQNNRVRKILPGGIISTAVGGSSGTALATPLAVAVDAAGAIYVADSSNIVRLLTIAGRWSDFAGTAELGFSGDGGPAAKAQLTTVRELATDFSGNVYIADGVRVRKVDAGSRIQSVAGDGYRSAIGDGGAAGVGQLLRPSAVAIDGAGNLYIADTGTERVRQVLPSGIIMTFAGTGIPGTGVELAAANTSALNSPMGVATDLFGNILIADTYNHRILQVGGDRRIRTLIGTGVPGLGPENMLPTQTQLRGPRAVCADRTGTLFIVDTSNHRVLRAPPGGVVETAAGNGAPGDTGDGGQARLAQLNQPGACALDSYGNLFIADTFSNRVRKVSPSGIIITMAGTGDPGASGDEGPATAASLRAPLGIAVDDSGNVFIADTGNNRVRQVTPDGIIHTIAGTDVLTSPLDSPGGLFLDGSGAIYVADTNHNRVCRLVPDSVLPPDPITMPPVLSAVSAASLRQGAVASGEILTIFGKGIGPESGVAGTFDAAGLLANLVSGVEARFDGIPAPLFYVQAGQINAQTPYTIAGRDVTHMEVFYQGHSAGALDLPVAPAAPALFPVVVNQDGSPNSETEPASRGTVLTFYGTGEGLTDGSNVSGKMADAPYSRPLLPVTLVVAGIKTEILYAGSAPGMVGLLQVNARVPSGFVPRGPAFVELTVGTATAPSITIWLN